MSDYDLFFVRVEAMEALKHIEEEEGPMVLWRGERASMEPHVSTAHWGTADWAKWGRQQTAWCIRPPDTTPKPSTFRWRKVKRS